jgi:preprotein translocase subunit SecE
VKLGAAILLVVVGIGAFYYFSDTSAFVRTLGLLLAGGVAVAISLQTDPGRETRDFVLEARAEVRKVVWPTRAETVKSSLVVMGMVVVMAILMWVLDATLMWIVRFLTGSES